MSRNPALKYYICLCVIRTRWSEGRSRFSPPSGGQALQPAPLPAEPPHQPFCGEGKLSSLFKVTQLVLSGPWNPLLWGSHVLSIESLTHFSSQEESVECGGHPRVKSGLETEVTAATDLTSFYRWAAGPQLSEVLIGVIHRETCQAVFSMTLVHVPACGSLVAAGRPGRGCAVIRLPLRSL